MWFPRLGSSGRNLSIGRNSEMLSIEPGSRLDAAEPWKSRKVDLERCGADLAALLELVHAVSLLLLPFLPVSASKMAATFSEATANPETAVMKLGAEPLLQPGALLNPPGILYPRLELLDDEEEESAS